ncbi:MAG: hypothetical protein FGM46_09645, partial [Ferruginibacter sp.]|nr:hypothetical protein [Ferruginibacter sp.]
MKKKLPIALIFSALFLFENLSAQNNFWKDINEVKAKNTSYERVIIPNKYRTVSLDYAGLLTVLKNAPKEFSRESISNPLVLAIPYPDGTIKHFNMVEYSMMEPELAAKFSNIKTYNGQGIEDKTARIKIDWTEFGFHAMILSDITGSVWIDPYAIGDLRNYISYYKKDLKPKYHEESGVLPAPFESRPLSGLGTQGGPCLGATLRTYRLAVTNTYQYAQAVKATTPAQLHSAIVTTVNRVNAVFESEVSVRFRLIDNNNLIEFLTATDDPFTTAANGSTSTLINESQTQIDRKIGSSNYDIGHAFCTGGGGLAQRGSACVNGSKARGVSGLPNPVGDAFDVDFVSHEIGHQLNASHTFNATTGSCSGNGTNATNAEPGSGCTIMAYAGQCTAANNLQLNSIPHFHGVSYDQISAFVSSSSTGGSCAATISTGNTAPVVNAGTDYTIPVSTPFTLTGSATDANGGALTYSWEQTDVGGTFSNWDAPSGNKAPLFRSFSPSSSPVRTFPRITDIVNNTRTVGEILPAIARPMNFRLTARDNRSGGGGVCYDDMIVTTSGTTSFTVTSQSTATTWTANGSNTATITWDVAGTTASPFNVSAVDILFSVDG